MKAKHMTRIKNVYRVSCGGLVVLLAAATNLLPNASHLLAQDVEDVPETPSLGVALPPGVETVDRVIAVVGDTAILESELQTTFYQLQARGAQIPPEGSEEWVRFARQVLVAEIDRLIILQQAKRAGLTADPATLDRRTEEEFQNLSRQFASEDEMREAVEEAGMNMLQYRQLLRRQSEADLLFEEYRFTLQSRTDLPSVLISESEVEQYFEENGGNDQQRPALVSFNQLVVAPTPTGAARDSALARVLQAQTELQSGDDFEIVARRHSEDEGTRAGGGELGWTTRDIVVKPFGDAVWRSRPGQTIGPIRTSFGLHLIKIERQRGAERFLRHILIRPEIAESDLESAQELAHELADSLRTGVDPERLMRLFSTRLADEDIRFDDVAAEQLAGRYSGEAAAALRSPMAGEVYGPLPRQVGGTTEYAVLHVLSYRPAGPVELDDVRDQIRRNIRLSKQIEVLLAEIRANTFIDVKL